MNLLLLWRLLRLLLRIGVPAILHSVARGRFCQCKGPPMIAVAVVLIEASGELKQWCERNKDRCYIPESS